MTKEELKAWRVKMGFTQKEACEALVDTPLKTYEQWERGISRPHPLLTLACLCISITTKPKKKGKKNGRK